MRIRLRAVLAIITVTVTCTPTVATAEYVQSESIGPEILQFVERVQQKWGFELDPDDYVIHEDPGGVIITERGQPAPSVQRQTGMAGATSMTVSHHSDNSPALQSTHDQAGIAQEVIWGAPNCKTRINKAVDGVAIAWIDHCYQWGNMDYAADSARHHVAFRGWLTCRSTNNNFAVLSCGNGVDRANKNGQWNDWKPRSDLQHDTCTQFGLSIGVGPVTASTSFNACDTQDIEKDNDISFMSTWRGKAVQHERESAFLIGFSVPAGYSAFVYTKTEWQVGFCNLVPGCPVADPI